MNDLNNTIVGLMSKTDIGTDLTSYIKPMEQALWAYFTKIINPIAPLDFKDTHDIRAIANEPTTTGRVFKGSMTFNEGSYTYTIAFRGKGTVKVQFYDDEIRRGTDFFNIFDCISVKDAFELLEKNRHAANLSQADNWYKKIPTADETAIVDRIEYLQAALEEAKAKLVICDNRVIIVPNRVILASKGACQVRSDVTDDWHKYIELDPAHFKSVELSIEKTTPNTFLAGPIG